MREPSDYDEGFEDRRFLFQRMHHEKKEGSKEPMEETVDQVTEERFALDTLERYSGCAAADFQKSLLLTNFPHYVDAFAKKTGAEIFEGSMFKVAHAKDQGISILDFKIGSPAAALVVDLCSFLPTHAALLLGMCGGLRRRYQVGDFLVPVASIRDEGTSDYYFPPEVPALSNFLILRAIIETMEEKKIPHHIGITYSTNKRFWEFNDKIKTKLKDSRAQGIEMECATLFMASYARKFSLGAFLLVSDLPLNNNGIKTKQHSKFVFEKYMDDHIQHGIDIVKRAEVLVEKKSKGMYDRTIYTEKNFE